MTALLSRLLGRLPIGWLQLTHNRTRLLAALAGVAFANILVFVQLGFLGALTEGIVLPYRALDADILISAADANTFSDGSSIPRQRMYQALATPGVADATPLYLANVEWQREPDDAVRLMVLGFDPRRSAFRLPRINAALDRLANLDVALIDDRTRNVEPAFFAAIEAGQPYRFEAKRRTVSIEGTFTIGPGFDADGYLVVSDQTFLNLLPQRSAGAPTHILVNVAPGVGPDLVVERLRAVLPAGDTIVRTLDAAAEADQRHQMTEKPIGIVFGFGVVMGILVGVVIVYQVLATDVADHLGEYATLKAIGYRQGFFLSIVFEEAIVLAMLGFVPGVLISLALYEVISTATGLPVVMSAMRPVLVFLGTVAMCAVSGAIATRRLAAADPADLF